jgi:DNA-directed RNA polymerase specialized sigma24 family protein
LINRQYQGDYEAVVLLTDLQTAIEAAKLTNRQREALRLVYNDDLTQVEAAKAMDITRENLKRSLEVAVGKIAEIYEYWGWHGEGYSLDKFDIGGDEE